ncbi:MAG: hypothetical protein OXH16_17340 [Gemmatimonadetes bacterium]|nr:hypothetical protein [Gemmatimonadota bacterium]
MKRISHQHLYRLKPFRTARESVSQQTFLWHPNCAGHCMAYCHKNGLRCASPSAFESGIFCLLFFAAEKK